MMMIIDISGNLGKFESVAEELGKLGGEIGVDIRLQSEEIFNSMHRI